MNNFVNLLIDENLRQLFNYWDTDGSGYLCKDELRELCARFCISASDSDSIFADLDRDGDGKISYQDFQSGFDDYEKGVMVSSIDSNTNNVESFECIRKALETEETREKIMNSSRLAKRRDLKKLSLNSHNGYSETYTSESADYLADSQTNTQAVIQDLLESVRSLQEENQRLANSWIREKKEHERHLVELEEEVDSQVKEVEIRVKQKAKEEVEAERRSMRDLMKGEMEELQTHLSMFEKVDSWLKNNQNNVTDDKVNEIRNKLDDSLQESRQLRLSLMDTQTNVALMRSELAQLRAQYEDKCRELSNEMGRVAEQQGEQQHLQRQLYLLQDANKRLHDTNDSLRTVMELTPNPSKCSSPQLNQLNNNMKTNPSYKRGSLIGDYMNQSPKSPVKTSSRLSEVDLESISTIEDEAASISHQSFASCPTTVGFMNKTNEDQFDSGFSLLTRDEELFMPSSRSLQSSPIHRNYYKNSKSSHFESIASPQELNSKNSEHLNTLSTSCESIHPTITEADGPPERTYKIIFVGDASVGKSTFVLRLSKGVFVTQLSTTLGVDFQVRSYKVEGRNVALQLWDTAGQERYRSITKNYFRKADGIMLLYDVTNEQSFLSVRQWINAVEEVTSKGVPVMVIGNKTDMRSTLQAQGLTCVKAEDGYKISQQYGLMFTETSCKDGNNILLSIAQLTKIMTQNEDNLIKNAGLSLTDGKAKRFGCC